MPRSRGWVVAVACVLVAWSARASEQPLSVLLLSGSNNHDWRATTPVLASILREAGSVVRVEEHVGELTPDAFDKHHVVLSNFNVFGQANPGPVWGPHVRAAFVRYIREGGGYVGVHAGGSVFDDWPEFKHVAGAWWGPQTGHGRIHEREVVVFATGHPITEGLEPFHARDEFWHGASLSPGAVVLAAVAPDPAHGGSGRPEPVLVTTAMGRGRGVALLLGHDAAAMQNPGFRRLLVRSVTWAAGARAASRETPPAERP